MPSTLCNPHQEWHLCIAFTYDGESVRLDQTAYIDSMLERYGLKDCNGRDTPMKPHTYLYRSDSPDTPNKENVKIYQQMVGSLMYLACGTRPDISFAVGQCAQFMSNPGDKHLEAVKHVFRYLKKTRNVGLVYSRMTPGLANVLYGFVDADHAGNSEHRRSTAGYVMMLNGAAVSWASSKIKAVALSSFESEWYAASICGCEVEALRRTLEEVGYEQSTATTLYEDNAATIYSSDPERPMSQRSKHIDTRVYRLRDLVRDDILILDKVESHHQMADVLTKALAAEPVTAARRYLSGDPAA